jgi:peptidoglycan/LPS O-acetylase OafA/YrhL
VLFPVIVAAGARIELCAAANRAALFLGKLSYPVYIIHHPMLRPFANTIRTHELTGPIFVLWTVLEVATIIIVAYLAMRFFDEPVRSRLAPLVLSRPASR